MKATSRIQNRPDIDGLRAIAVLSVFLYHLEVPPFGGGFVGVDIFFVISGYLISRIVLTDVERGSFSMVRFYERRIRRLAPAGIVTIIGTLLIGFLWFSPEHFKGLTQDVVATVGSVSNFYFWRSSHDYFAKAVDPSPVLHFWSLAVEEQFYLVWPAFIMVGHRLVGKGLPLAILGIGAISLIAAQMKLGTDAAGAFYLPIYRAYEFALGALVIFAERWQPRFRAMPPLLAVVGFGLIACAIVSFDGATAFPGVNALIPCLGAACLIWAGPSHPLARLLTNPLAVRIGLISYSLYLVHWPLIVYAAYILGDAAHAAGPKLCVFVLAIALAELMYRTVETPFRARRSSLVSVAGFAGAAIVAIASVAFIANRQDGWPWRLSPEARQVVDLQRFGFWPCSRSSQSKCAFGAVNEPIGVQLIGDSFAEQYVAAIDPVARDAGVRGEAYTEEGCPMLAGLIRTGFDGTAKCKVQRDKYLDTIRMNNSPLVLSQSWLTYGDSLHSELSGSVPRASPLEVWRGGIEDTIRDLGAGGRKFLIIAPGVEPGCRRQMTRFAPGPLWHAPTRPCPPVSPQQVEERNKDFNAMLLDVQQRHRDQVRILFPEKYLCDADCPIETDGLWLYWDVNHLTVAGARRVGAGAWDLIRGFITDGNLAREQRQ
jgi:peptidoglycan/LPS O-acetylase OafA/YrhL